MKKLTTLSIAILAILLGSTAVHAQAGRWSKKPAHIKPAKNVKQLRNNKRRVVHTYFTTQIVWKHGRKYKNTYKISVFPRGRTQKSLVRSVPIRNQRFTRTHFHTYTVYEWGKPYRVTYKIQRFRNGYVSKKLMKKVRLYRANY